MHLCDPDCTPNSPECGCLHKKVEVVDSVKAKKALACVEELRQMILGELPCDVREERAVLKRYGFL